MISGEMEKMRYEKHSSLVERKWKEKIKYNINRLKYLIRNTS